MDKSLPRITDLAEGRDKPKEKDYIDFFEDMEKSVFGAAQSLGYSFGDLITTGIDLAAGTDLTSKLDEVYEKNKIESPETLLGSVNKVLIEFGIPGGAVFKVMNRAKKLFKGKKGDRQQLQQEQEQTLQTSQKEQDIWQQLLVLQIL